MSSRPAAARAVSSSAVSALPGILIIDDSAVARAVMTRIIDASDRFTVAGAVQGAKTALAFLDANRVDAILLDIEMPGIDGITALPNLIAASRGAKILVVSSVCDDGGAAAVQAMALGAADTLEKPGIGSFGGVFSQMLIDKLSRLLEASDVMSAPARIAAPKTNGAGFDIVAIGASTGGIHALSQLLREIPASFQLPILITQHLPASFMPYFAAQLAMIASRPCDVATDRLRIRPGRLIVAPGDGHLRIVSLGDGSAAVRLTDQPARSGCMPSVDPMLESLAQVYGPRVLAVVLSGMGRDGSDGARSVIEAGGCVIVQDKASSVVWGMPGAIAGAGGASAILPPDEIGRLIATRRRPA